MVASNPDTRGITMLSYTTPTILEIGCWHIGGGIKMRTVPYL